MNALLFICFIVGGTAILSWPLGRYMHWAMDRATKAEQQNWKQYCGAMLVFNALMFAIGFGILLLQGHLPLNPDGKTALEVSLAFHTTASFTTNTNLQHYSGEATLSYFSQLFALMWLQYVSAATGIAALAALARGLAGRERLGNFFSDLQRAMFLVLLPLALIVAMLLVLGGMPMTLRGAASATTLEGAVQIVARGPVAAFVAIKQLGTNGGGWFGPNGTHPFENPSFWTNCLAMITIILIPMASVWMFGRIVGRMRHAGVVFGVMLALLVTKIGCAVWCETEPTRAFAELPVEQATGNLEGKELRFGATSAPLWAVLTTATSSGSVNAMHDSLNPLTGLLPMVGMWLNATFGGVGVGMINMFIYIVIAVFVAGMMVGRTPEYLNRRIEAREMTASSVTLLAHPLLILCGTALFAAMAWGQDAITNPGAHGFSEILYEFSSAAANNGSGFEGLSDNTVPWNVATGIVMLLGRFIPIILPLMMAGSLAGKKPTAQSAGTLGTETGTFGVMLVATILIVGALTFMPVAVLGPIAEHLAFMQ